RGITAVSAVSLFYKGNDYTTAQAFACRCLANEQLPAFAVPQLQNLLQTVWGEQAIAAAGLTFAKQDVLVSVRGGEVLTGGAPLDLILRKVEEVRALFYRTVEWIMNKPLRVRGGPTQDIQGLFRPWLFQAPPGSYQFAVRLESPKQMEFGIVASAVPPVEEVTRAFIEIVSATASGPEEKLAAQVSDPGYRNAFLKLTRNLAPTGKSFTELEIRSNANPSIGSVMFAPASRKAINDSIKKHAPSVISEGEGEVVKLEGILRAVHLDHDWLEVTVDDGGEKHIKVLKAGDAIDDVVGPMVNRRVTVDAVRTPNGKHFFKDIQSME
ncbi:MAG TPA: hypothetical protein VFC17_15550, partial [Candidatus Limnocylindrales bacterium]|nr:hypothetical protein [Candidatus Limnocylindrales bacterium]